MSKVIITIVDEGDNGIHVHTDFGTGFIYPTAPKEYERLTNAQMAGLSVVDLLNRLIAEGQTAGLIDGAPAGSRTIIL